MAMATVDVVPWVSLFVLYQSTFQLLLFFCVYYAVLEVVNGHRTVTSIGVRANVLYLWYDSFF